MRSPLPGVTQELIFLDPDDDMATVRAKLESTAADEVYLVIPQNASILRTPLEFRILGRLAGELASEVIIVSSDGHRRFLARQEGFRTKRSWQQVRYLLDPSAQPGLLSALADWLPWPSARGLVTAVAVLLVVLSASAVIVPEMRVTLTPSTDMLSQSVELIIDQDAVRADPTRNTLPGRRLEQRVEVSGSVQTSGTAQVGRGRAVGEAIFQNREREEIRIPQGTVVKTATGVRFATSNDIVVPPLNPSRPGQSGTPVAVTAVDPGTSGNVPAGTINQIEGSFPPGLSVSNPRPTTGGTDRETLVVSEQDVTRLREQLLRQARDEATLQFRTGADEDAIVVEDTLELAPLEERFEPDIGMASERLSGRMAVRASALVTKRHDLDQLVRRAMAARIDPEFTLVGSPPSIRSLEVIEVRGRSMVVRIDADAVIVRALDRGQLQSTLIGKSPDEARAILSRIQGLADPPSLEIWPSWSPRAFRVAIDVAAPR